MKLICLKDYIKLFIKEKYITNKKNIINIKLVDGNNDIKQFFNILIDFTSKKERIIFNNNDDLIISESNILKFPVNSVSAIIFNKKNIDFTNLYEPKDIINIIKFDLSEFKIANDIDYKPTIYPTITELQSLSNNCDVCVSFNCPITSTKYINSFLFKKDILRIHFLQMLSKYGNTVMSVSHYKKAIEYITKHYSKFTKIKNLDPCKILEKHIASIVRSFDINKNRRDCYKIKYFSDTQGPYYIIESVKKSCQK